MDEIKCLFCQETVRRHQKYCTNCGVKVDLSWFQSNQGGSDVKCIGMTEKALLNAEEQLMDCVNAVEGDMDRDVGLSNCGNNVSSDALPSSVSQYSSTENEDIRTINPYVRVFGAYAPASSSIVPSSAMWILSGRTGAESSHSATNATKCTDENNQSLRKTPHQEDNGNRGCSVEYAKKNCVRGDSRLSAAEISPSSTSTGGETKMRASDGLCDVGGRQQPPLVSADVAIDCEEDGIPVVKSSPAGPIGSALKRKAAVVRSPLPKVLVINVCSLLKENNKQRLKNLMNLNSVDFAVITETFLTEDDTPADCHIAGYEFKRFDRLPGAKRASGGVGIYSKTSFTSRKWSPYRCSVPKRMELLWIKSSRVLDDTKTYFVASVYFPPHCGQTDELFEYMKASVDQIVRRHPSAAVVIAGDFNSFPMDLLPDELNLEKYDTPPTRETGTNILDRVYTLEKQRFTQIDLLTKVDHNVLTDHCALIGIP